MTWFHRGVLIFFSLLALLWVGHSISSVLSLCRVSHPLASPLFLFEASASRYQAPFLLGLLVLWFGLSHYEAKVRQVETVLYLKRNLHGVFAILTWLAFPFYKLFYLSLWGLFAFKNQRPQRLALSCTLGLVMAGLSQNTALLACVAPPASTHRNAQQVEKMLTVYQQSHGRYPAHWRELQLEIQKNKRFRTLQNPYDPQRAAVIDFQQVLQPHWASLPNENRANHYTDIAGFRLYHQWWKSPVHHPQDQGVIVYHSQSPQYYALYRLNHSGELIKD